jgi:hypothetical protein
VADRPKPPSGIGLRGGQRNDVAGEPGPPAEDQPTVETEAAAALESVIGDHRVGFFSLARVDGGQLRGLCGETVSGPAYLATLDTDLSATPRRMTVVLAGPTPRACAAAAI